ncbi:MAG: carbohydrate-binding family 9-like protein, partial [Verrucomicrobiota bacterium]
LNTTYEVFFLWEAEWERAGFSAAPEWARNKLQPFNGVGFNSHPRGGRLGNFHWFFPGKRTAVFVDGTLNDDRDRDRGWSVEVAFPWAGMKWLATDGRALPPKERDVWRIDLSRFNQYREAPPAQDSGGWALSAHRVWDSHVPECFPRVRFTTRTHAAATGAGSR